MRSPSDAVRKRAHAALLAELRAIAKRRGVKVEIDTFQENPATALDPAVIEAAGEAIEACGQEPLRLSSGAGHDAGIMAKLCPSGMIFVRCKDGISHNPAESITVADADLGVRAMLEAVRALDRRLLVAAGMDAAMPNAVAERPTCGAVSARGETQALVVKRAHRLRITPMKCRMTQAGGGA